MIWRFLLTSALCVVAFSTATGAAEQAETLEQLRQRYQQARDVLAKTENPELGSEGFPEKLKVWAAVYQQSQASARALISALLNHWRTLPDDSAEVPAVCKEIKTVFQEMAAPPSEQYNLAKSFLARAAWPLLADEKLTPKRAAFLVELTEPQMLVREKDRLARLGQSTEPLGWDVQAAYALALIRSGKDKQAGGEITALHHKVAVNHKVNPEGRLDYGPEAGEARYRNYIDYLQLCEILLGLQAAVAGDHAGAARRVEQARELRDVLSPEASLLIAEIGRRAKADED